MKKGFSNKYSRPIAIKSFLINTSKFDELVLLDIFFFNHKWNELVQSNQSNIKYLLKQMFYQSVSDKQWESISIHSFFWSTNLLELNTRHHEALSVYQIQSSKSPTSFHRPFFQSDIISYYYFPIFVFRSEVKDRRNWP